MKIKDITNRLESYAPLRIQESYDNCGLIVGDENSELTNVLTTLDVTEDVVQEAMDSNCNLIVAHHPIVFFGLKKFNPNTYVERVVLKAIKNNIAIYAIHTNLDKVYNGVNKAILDKLGIKNGNLLKNELLGFNTPGSPFGHIGSGMIGNLDKPEFIIDFLERVKKTFKCGIIKHTPTSNKKINTVAVCGGAGFFLLKDAIKMGADVLLTADVTYHQFFDADKKIVLADIGHFESEQYTKELLKEILDNGVLLNSFNKTLISKTNTNPVNYI